MRSDVKHLAESMRAGEALVPTSRWARLWRSGKGGARLASALLLRDAAPLVDTKGVRALAKELGELKGMAMKMGQILGYIDPTLDETIAAHLSVLHTSAAKSPFVAVEASLREALGSRVETLLTAMDPEPFAVASIGQVHRAELGGAPVAVKVRHPGIENALEQDFRTAGAGAAFALLLAPGAGRSVRSMVEEVKVAVLEECDYGLEAERQRRFGELFADDPGIRVPAVLDAWSSRGVLVSELLEGENLDAFLARNPSQLQRDEAGRALFRFYVGTLYQHGLFHADPHPGNFAFLSSGELVIYDFGCVRSFEPETVAVLARLVRAVCADNLAAMCEAFVALGGRVDGEAEADQLRLLLRGFFSPLLQDGPSRIQLERGFGVGLEQLATDKRALMRLQLPPKLLFLLRLRFGLYAVLSRLGAQLDWAELESSLLVTKPAPAATPPPLQQNPPPERSQPDADVQR